MDGSQNLHASKHEDARQIALLPRIHLQAADARIRQREDGHVPEHVGDAEPQQEPDARSAGQPVARVDAADRRADDEEDEPPERDEADEDVVSDAEGPLGDEESAVEEEHAQLEGCVGDFLDDERGLVDLFFGGSK